jgi:hypothetical protein
LDHTPITGTSVKLHTAHIIEQSSDHFNYAHLFLRGIVVELELAAAILGFLLAGISMVTVLETTVSKRHCGDITTRNLLKLNRF